MSERRRRGRPALWDPSRLDIDYFALRVMVERAGEKPIQPYALARAALAHARKVFRFVNMLHEEGFFHELQVRIEGADEETLERCRQIGKEAFARRRVIDPYRYGDNQLYVNRLRNKYLKLLGFAEYSLFFRDFPDGNVDDFAGYCRTAEEKRQEALRIIKRLWDRQLERLVEDELA